MSLSLTLDLPSNSTLFDGSSGWKEQKVRERVTPRTNSYFSLPKLVYHCLIARGEKEEPTCHFFFSPHKQGGNMSAQHSPRRL